MRSLESTFASTGCLLEVYSPMMVAVDGADEDKADWLVAVLEQLATQGGLEYEPVHASPRELDGVERGAPQSSRAAAP